MTWSSMLSSLILSTSSTGLTSIYIMCHPVVKAVKDIEVPHMQEQGPR